MLLRGSTRQTAAFCMRPALCHWPSPCATTVRHRERIEQIGGSRFASVHWPKCSFQGNTGRLRQFSRCLDPLNSRSDTPNRGTSEMTTMHHRSLSHVRRNTHTPGASNEGSAPACSSRFDRDGFSRAHAFWRTCLCGRCFDSHKSAIRPPLSLDPEPLARGHRSIRSATLHRPLLYCLLAKELSTRRTAVRCGQSTLDFST